MAFRTLLLALIPTVVFADKTILDTARNYRDGNPVMKTPRNAALAVEFYEVIVTQLMVNSSEYDIALAALELSELLESEPTHLLSSEFSYLDLLMRSADAGNGDAQHKLSVAYATGVAARDLVPMDSGRAAVLEYMSALSGNPVANMGMGFRYLNGIGVVESCERALPFYEFAANHVADLIRREGIRQQPDRLKLSEVGAQWMKREGSLELIEYYTHLAEDGDGTAASMLGNMYLMGTRTVPIDEKLALHYLNIAADRKNVMASGVLGYTLIIKYINEYRRQLSSVDRSTSSSSIIGMHSFTPDGKQLDQIVHLLTFASDKSDVSGALGLALASYHGIGVPVNMTRALETFHSLIGIHADAGFYLGEVCMGLKPLNASADMRGDARYIKAMQGTSNGLLESFGAINGYALSAQLGNVLAQHRLGHLHLGRGQTTDYSDFPSRLASSGSSDSSQYSSSGGTSAGGNCKLAVKNFKAVAERGPWMAGLKTAHKHYSEGRLGAALHEFTMLAAVGVEVAQFNAAYMLSKCSSACPPSYSAPINACSDDVDHSLSKPPASNLKKLLKHLHERAGRTRAAEGEGQLGDDAEMRDSAVYLDLSVWEHFISQYEPTAVSSQLPGSVDSSIGRKVKEFHRVESETRALILFDLSASQGNSDSSLMLGDLYYYNRAGLVGEDVRRQAAGFYRQAAELRHTQAIFNLGLMHETGDGVAQDFHLAKRYYDQAATFDEKAKLPRDIALMMLEGHKFLNDWFGTETIALVLGTSVHVPSFISPWLNVSPGSIFTMQDLANAILHTDAQLQEHLDYFAYRYQELLDKSLQNNFGKMLLGRIQLYTSLLQSFVFGSGGSSSTDDHADTAFDDPLTVAAAMNGRDPKHAQSSFRKAMLQLAVTMRSYYFRIVPGLYLHAKAAILSIRFKFSSSPVTVQQQDSIFSEADFLLLALTSALLLVLLVVRLLRRRLVVAFR